MRVFFFAEAENRRRYAATLIQRVTNKRLRKGTEKNKKKKYNLEITTKNWY